MSSSFVLPEIGCAAGRLRSEMVSAGQLALIGPDLAGSIGHLSCNRLSLFAGTVGTLAAGARYKGNYSVGASCHNRSPNNAIKPELGSGKVSALLAIGNP